MTNRSMVAVLAVSAFIGMTAIVSFDILMPYIAEDLGSSVAELARISMVMFIGGACLGTLLGPLADHYGLRRTILTGSGLLVLSVVLTAASTEYWMLLISRIPAGFGIMGAVSVAIAAARLPESERRKGIGWIVTTIPLAAIAGSPTLGVIAYHTSWRVSYLVLATVILGLTVLLWRFVPPDPPWPAERFHATAVLDAYRPILRNPTSVLLYGADVLRLAGTWLLFIFLSAYLVQVHELTLQQVSAVYTLAGISYVIGTRIGNHDLSWISLESMLKLSTVVMAPIGILVFSEALGLVASLVALLLYTFAGGIGFPAITIKISEASRGQQGTTMMLRQAFIGVGQATAAGLGGALLTLGGFPMITLGGSVLLIGAVVLLVFATQSRAAEAREPVPTSE